MTLRIERGRKGWEAVDGGRYQRPLSKSDLYLLLHDIHAALEIHYLIEATNAKEEERQG